MYQAFLNTLRHGSMLLLCIACIRTSIAQDSPGPDNLRYFGYALVDCGVPDRFAGTSKTNYVSEVSAFSNLAQLCVFNATDNIIGRLKQISNANMRAVLSIQAVLFYGVPDNSTGSKLRFRLYPDYQVRWQTFINNNALLSNAYMVGAFYIADEPTWNGVSASDLKLASDLVKNAFPSTPTLVIEAAPVIDKLVIPTSIDWVGFDHYAIPQPDTNSTYLKELALLKSKRTRIDQKVILVMEGQWLPYYGSAGYPESYLAEVAKSYFNLGKSDPDIIGMLAYLWPGGLEDPQQKGVRNLPSNVLTEHMNIGKAISRK